MWRFLGITATLFVLGVYAAFVVPSQSSVTALQGSAGTTLPTLSSVSYTQLPQVNQTTAPTVVANVVGYSDSVDARFAGMLSHVRWLIAQNETPSISRRRSNNTSLFDKQVDSLLDDISESADELREEFDTSLLNYTSTPDSILALGQTDEYCLTYESTGTTFEWQTCGSGGGMAATDIDTSLELASILTDETGTGALVFAGSPTLSGTMNAVAANFSGNVGIGTTTPLAKLAIDASSSDITPLTITTNGSAGNYTAQNSGIFVYDDAGTELLRIWASDPSTANYNSQNLYIGFEAGKLQPTDNVSAGYYNTGVGARSLASNSTGYWNSAFGWSSLESNTIGYSNSAFGEEALVVNVSGDNNNAFGTASLWRNTTGDNNTGVGTYSLFNNVSGSSSLAVGTFGLYYSTGSRNTGIGSGSGFNPSNDIAQYRIVGDTDMVLLGYGATKNNASTLTNGIAIGSGAHVLQSNQAVLGNDSITSTLLKGNVGIGTTSPSKKLTVSGDAEIGNAAGANTGLTFTTRGLLVNASSAGTSGGDIGLFSNFNRTSLSNSSAGSIGGLFTTYNNGSVNYTGYNIGADARANHYSTGTFNQIQGFSSFAYNYQGSSGNALKGFNSYVESDTGAVANIYGLYHQAAVFGGSVANNYGAYLRNPDVSGGTLANNYGLYIEAQTAGSINYGIYSAGGTNYFAGDTGIGSTSPSSKLTIQNTGSGNSFIVEDQASDTTPFVITASGDVGIGIGSPTGAKLYVNGTGGTGIYSGNLASGGGNAWAAGFESYSNADSSNYSELWGSWFYNNHQSSGSLTQAADIYIYPTDNTGGGTIATNYGIYIGDKNVGNTNYSLYTNQSAGTNNYALYNAGAGKSYFAGNVGIASTSPSAKLTVQNTGTGNSFIVEDQAGDTTAFVIDAAGNVGIGGITDSTKKLWVSKVSTATSGYQANSSFWTSANPSSNSTSYIYGVDSYAYTESGNSSNISGLTAVYGESDHSGTGTLGQQNGLYGYTGNYSSGIVTDSSVVRAEAYNSASGVIASQKFININQLYNSGVITNTYGLYIGDITAGTQTNQAYSIYASDANTRNYFAGNVGIGSTSPSSKLTIQNTGSGNSFIVEDQAGDTTPFVIDASGNVGIGGLAPSNTKLYVDETSATSKNLISASLTADPTVSGFTVYNGGSFYAETQSGNSFNLGGLTAVYGYTAHAGGGNLIANAGGYFESANTGTATIDRAYGIVTAVYNSNAGGTINTSKGIEITDLDNVGTIGNTYGLYLGDLTSGTQTNQAYSIYASDANTRNYFAGNVGIGSTSPSSKLTIQNTGSGNSFIVEDQASDTTPFVIANDGRVGIGTANPDSTYKLNLENVITGTASSWGMLSKTIVNPSSSAGFYGAGDFYTNSQSGNSNTISQMYGIDTYTNHQGSGNVGTIFGVGAGSANSSSGIVTNAQGLYAYVGNGNAGGTISSAKMIEVLDLYNAGTVTNTYGLYLGDLTAGTQTNQAYSIYASDANTRNYLAGNLGIGTTSPAQKLQVLGNIRVGTAGGNGCLEDFAGTLISGTCSSDQNLKENIEPIAQEGRSYLEALAALTPVTYTWNETAGDLYSKDTNFENLGLVAQDVEAQFPELVSLNDEGYRQVNFSAFPFYIIEALKEVWQKIQGHDERIESLEQENEYLKSRLNEIEDELNIDTPPPPAPEAQVEPTSEVEPPTEPAPDAEPEPAPAPPADTPPEPAPESSV